MRSRLILVAHSRRSRCFPYSIPFRLIGLHYPRFPSPFACSPCDYAVTTWNTRLPSCALIGPPLKAPLHCYSWPFGVTCALLVPTFPVPQKEGGGDFTTTSRSTYPFSFPLFPLRLYSITVRFLRLAVSRRAVCSHLLLTHNA